MNTIVTKRTLGRGYVVTAGLTLSVVLLVHAFVALRTNPLAALVAVAGLVPSLALAGVAYWLPESGLDGDGIWTVAKWSGLGIAVLTLLNLMILATDRQFSTVTPALLSTGIALGGATGVLVGSLLELRRSARRLDQANTVLGRVIQHNLRNDLTVVLGHLGELEREVPADVDDRVDQLGAKVDDILSTAEKARQIDVALDGADREKRPVDVVSPLRKRLNAVERTHPDVTVERELPAHAVVVGDWFVKTVIDNVVENVVVHSDGTPELRVSVEREANAVVVRFVDDCPPIPENERAVFTGERETPLDHSTGVGLWLVRLVMESYGGDVGHAYNDDGGNIVELRFHAAAHGRGNSYLDRIRTVVGRARSIVR